jgi:outer membrane receptor protein involved in Fe transport
VRLAPDYTVNAAIGYRHPSGFVAEAGCQGIGGYPFFEDNDRGQGPYQLVTARIGWTSTHFGIYLYGRNLADQIYYPFALPPSGPIGYVATPGDPRTVGVMLVAQF